MDSTITQPDRTQKSSVHLILMVGITIGLAVGVTGYLVVNWLFNFDDSGFNQIVSDNSNENANTSSVEAAKTEVDWIFKDELRQSELLEVAELLNTLDLHQLLDLTTTSSTQPWTPRLYTIQEMLVELLVQSSPLEAVASLKQFPEHRRRSLLQLVFTHWSKSKLEEAIAAADDLPRSQKRVAMGAIFEERSDLSSEDFSLTANKFDFKSELDAREQEIAIYGLLDQDPSSAFDRLLNDEIDDRQQRDLYQQVVEKWFEYDGMNILTILDDAPIMGGLSGDLVDLVVGQDRVAALEFIQNVDESRRSGLGHQLFDSWSRSNTEEALQVALDLPKSTFRDSMLSSVVRDWAEEAPNAVLDRLLEIPRLYRADAVLTVANQFALENPKNALEQIELFRSVPGSSVDRAVQTILRSWSDDAPDHALDWIQSNMKEGSRDRTEALFFVLYQYAPLDPERAMTIAVEEIHPAARASFRDLDQQVIDALVVANRFDTAIELLDQIQDGDKLLSSAVRIGGRLVEANRMDDSFLVADLLTEERRIEYFYGMASNLLRRRKSALLDLIERLPSAESRTSVVARLVKNRPLERYLNTEQIKTLKSYMSE